MIYRGIQYIIITIQLLNIIRKTMSKNKFRRSVSKFFFFKYKPMDPPSPHNMLRTLIIIRSFEPIFEPNTQRSRYLPFGFDYWRICNNSQHINTNFIINIFPCFTGEYNIVIIRTKRTAGEVSRHYTATRPWRKCLLFFVANTFCNAKRKGN